MKYRKAGLIGCGFAGIFLVWTLYSNFVPIFLAEFGINATLIGFIMTWDNYFNMFIQPTVGAWSDRTHTRIGRRKPWLLLGAPLAALFFVAIPLLNSLILLMVAILITHIGLALCRPPTVALMGDLFPPDQRSTANGIINLMGGIGAIIALVGGGMLYQFGRLTPFAFGSIILLISMLTILLGVREPPQARHAPIMAPRNFWSPLATADRAKLLTLGVVLGAFMGIQAVQTWLSSFGKFSLGIPPDRMALIMICFALPFLLMAVPSGMLANRLGRRRVVLAALMLMSLLLSGGWFVQSQTSLMVMLVLSGTTWAFVSVNALPLVYDVSSHAGIGTATGLYYLATNIAAVVGPQLAGMLIDLSGKNYWTIFLVAAFFMSLAALCLSQLQQRGPAVINIKLQKR